MNKDSNNHNQRCRFTTIPILFAAILLLTPAFASAQKTDVITFKNGDKLNIVFIIYGG